MFDPCGDRSFAFGGFWFIMFSLLWIRLRAGLLVLSTFQLPGQPNRDSYSLTSRSMELSVLHRHVQGSLGLWEHQPNNMCAPHRSVSPLRFRFSPRFCSVLVTATLAIAILAITALYTLLATALPL